MTDILSGYVGWTLKHRTEPTTQIELSKVFGPSNLFIIVAGPDGYNHKWYKSEPDTWGRSTKDYDLHLSMNGPCQMTTADWNEVIEVVERAKEFFADG